ncbi:hypothetical protein VCR5J5_1090019 [Vibrio crassostreae]|uniref:Uncharacterized protein n=1 Tax=Vibrio crassostreae TaxID=246167 RepID=A0A822MLK7_9VIBR|nr:hypothetical protein VCR5J5_1090019 [Vibrio crassostreae]CDT17296.1 hypothetical protein VCR9J2_1630017 [Vibrio crassostreae]
MAGHLKQRSARFSIALERAFYVRFKKGSQLAALMFYWDCLE